MAYQPLNASTPLRCKPSTSLSRQLTHQPLNPSTSQHINLFSPQRIDLSSYQTFNASASQPIDLTNLKRPNPSTSQPIDLTNLQKPNASTSQHLNASTSHPRPTPHPLNPKPNISLSNSGSKGSETTLLPPKGPQPSEPKLYDLTETPQPLPAQNLPKSKPAKREIAPFFPLANIISIDEKPDVIPIGHTEIFTVEVPQSLIEFLRENPQIYKSNLKPAFTAKTEMIFLPKQVSKAKYTPQPPSTSTPQPQAILDSFNFNGSSFEFDQITPSNEPEPTKDFPSFSLIFPSPMRVTTTLHSLYHPASEPKPLPSPPKSPLDLKEILPESPPSPKISSNSNFPQAESRSKKGENLPSIDPEFLEIKEESKKSDTVVQLTDPPSQAEDLPYVPPQSRPRPRRSIGKIDLVSAKQDSKIAVFSAENREISAKFLVFNFVSNGREALIGRALPRQHSRRSKLTAEEIRAVWSGEMVLNSESESSVSEVDLDCSEEDPVPIVETIREELPGPRRRTRSKKPQKPEKNSTFSRVFDLEAGESPAPRKKEYSLFNPIGRSMSMIYALSEDFFLFEKISEYEEISKLKPPSRKNDFLSTFHSQLDRSFGAVRKRLHRLRQTPPRFRSIMFFYCARFGGLCDHRRIASSSDRFSVEALSPEFLVEEEEIEYIAWLTRVFDRRPPEDLRKIAEAYEAFKRQGGRPLEDKARGLKLNPMMKSKFLADFAFTCFSDPLEMELASIAQKIDLYRNLSEFNPLSLLRKREDPSSEASGRTLIYKVPLPPARLERTLGVVRRASEKIGMTEEQVMEAIGFKLLK